MKRLATAAVLAVTATALSACGGGSSAPADASKSDFCNAYVSVFERTMEVDQDDYDALRDTAHSLKSSSANLGAMLLSASARRIEAGARAGTLERPAVAVAMVANEFARARARLRAGRATTA